MKKTKIDHYTDKEALDFHNSNKSGKIEIISSKPMTTKRDLALAYSPGVAAPVRAISENPEEYYNIFNPIVDQVASNPLIDYLIRDTDIIYEENFTCPQLWERLVIGSDGRALLCSNDEFSEHIIGDANTESIFEIWHGKKMTNKNPWKASTLEWTTGIEPLHGNWPGKIPSVYRWPYDYSKPGYKEDFVPQHIPLKKGEEEY